jgi:hypothetical protein
MMNQYVEFYLVIASLIAFMLLMICVSFFTMSNSDSWDLIRSHLEGTSLHDASIPMLIFTAFVFSILYAALWVFTVPLTLIFMSFYLLEFFC